LLTWDNHPGLKQRLRHRSNHAPSPEILAGGKIFSEVSRREIYHKHTVRALADDCRMALPITVQQSITPPEKQITADHLAAERGGLSAFLLPLYPR
jgi:hypothetical protein